MNDAKNVLQRGGSVLGHKPQMLEPQFMYQSYWVSPFDPKTGSGPSGNSAMVVAYYSPVLEAISWGYCGA